MNSSFISFLISLFLLLISLQSFAQDSTKAVRHLAYYNHFLEINGGLKKEQGFGRAALIHLHGIGKKKQRFKLGYGASFTSFFGVNRFYRTAPSRYTSTREDHFTAFSETIDKNIDTLFLPYCQVNLINASFHIQYTILKNLDLGYTADIIGISLGPLKEGTVISNVYDGQETLVRNIEPTKFNLLLTGDNNIGSLHSEFYLRYWILQRVSLRVGYSFLLTEYSTREPLYFDNARIVNDRFRNRTSMISLGLTFRPFFKRSK